MRIFAAAILVAGSLLLASCGTRVDVQVQSFSAADAPRAGERVFVLPAQAAPGAELEAQSWVAIARQEFAARGLLLVDRAEEADLLASVGLTIDGGRTEQRPYAIPQFGITGYSGSTTTGTVASYGGMATYNAATTLTPTYGVTGYVTGIESERVFRRRAALTVTRRSPDGRPAPVFQSRGDSEGSCGTLAAVSPDLIKALFARFPQGGVQRVTTRMQTRC